MNTERSSNVSSAAGLHRTDFISGFCIDVWASHLRGFSIKRRRGRHACCSKAPSRGRLSSVEPLPLVADAPIAIDINLLQDLFLRDRLASFDSLPQDPRLAPSAGVKLCTYHRWFGRPQNAACPSYWESPMGNAKLHRILRFRMGSHHLPVEEGRHFNLPRAIRVCNLLPCSGVMRRLLWAKDQHEVCRYIIACLDRMSSH